MPLFPNKNINFLVSFKTIHNQIFSAGVIHEILRLQIGYISKV